MEWIGPVAGVVVGFVLGAVALWALGRTHRDALARAGEELVSARKSLEEERTRRQESEVARAAADERARQAEGLREEIAQRDQRLSALQEDLTAEATRAKGLETQLEQQQRNLEEQKKLLEDAKTALKEAFEALSSDALRKNNASFLELAKEKLESFAKEAQGDLAQRQEAIAKLVQPIEKTLDAVQKQAHELETKREGAYGQISEQIKGMMETQGRLEREARNLTIALRNPQQRGSWGEMQLKTLAEQSGMVEGVHFTMQESTDTDDGRLRPDMIVNLPNNKQIVIDAKTPEAYLRAMQTDDDDARAQLLRDHAAFVRRHLTDLSAKDYARQFDQAPDFVVMFLPGESFFAAALQADPTLLEAGAAKNVLLASPTTLLALLKAVAYGWRQENLAANAQKIATKGRELYERLCTALEHFAKAGRGLSMAVGAYNDTVGSLERSVLPSARVLKEMGIASTKEIGEMLPLDIATREFQAPEARPLPEPGSAGSGGEA